MTDQPTQLTVPRLLPIAAAAQIMGCSPKTVRRRIAVGTLPAVLENGRPMIRADELADYIRGLDRPVPPRAPQRRRHRPQRGVYDFLNE